jgi:hypothetical protein
MTEHEKAAWQTTGLAVLAAIAIGLAPAFIPRRGRARIPRHVRALRAYLFDHLAGSDAATALVDRLREAQTGTSVGELAERLQREFRQERDVVTMLLGTLESSPRSVKRASPKWVAARHR